MLLLHLSTNNAKAKHFYNLKQKISGYSAILSAFTDETTNMIRRTFRKL